MNKFSIIIPVYNVKKELFRKTLVSIVDQTYDNYEYLIIDGKSSDNTLNIIKEYESRFNDKLKIISESDNGLYDAMNKAVKVAKGDWLFFINSDDVFINNECLQNVAYYLLQPNLLVCLEKVT